MPKQSYRYATLNATGRGGRPIDFESGWPKTRPHAVAQDAAIDCYDTARRRLDAWPLVFKIWTGDGELMGMFEVFIETRKPSFVVTDV